MAAHAYAITTDEVTRCLVSFQFDNDFAAVIRILAALPHRQFEDPVLFDFQLVVVAYSYLGLDYCALRPGMLHKCQPAA